MRKSVEVGGFWGTETADACDKEEMLEAGVGSSESDCPDEVEVEGAGVLDPEREPREPPLMGVTNDQPAVNLA